MRELVDIRRVKIKPIRKGTTSRRDMVSGRSPGGSTNERKVLIQEMMLVTDHGYIS